EPSTHPHAFSALLSAWQAKLKATGDATLKQQGLPREPDLLPGITRSSKPYAGGCAAACNANGSAL
ncbi:MAG TPA: hypothetical protein VKB96_06410, partial [Gammaproteobacteria bacterium]|nr:hypothetical protein [Gammaproteobacteria bacterium]